MSRSRIERITRGWLAATVLAPVLLLVVSGVLTRLALGEAGEHLDHARTAFAHGNPAVAQRDLARAQGETHRARRLTSGPLWSAAAALPWLGRTSGAVRTGARVADRITQSVLPPLFTAAATFDGQELGASGGLDLARIREVTPILKRAQRRVAAVRRTTGTVQGPLLWPVSGQVRGLRAQIAQLETAIDGGVVAARLLPTMLGSGTARTYLLAVQNPAESRGTGGLLGAYGVMTAADGLVSLRKIGPNSDLRSSGPVPADLGASYRAYYGNDPALWVNANLSPHFPYAARIWLGLWQRQFHERLDGVIALDPIALGDLVDATGPIRLADGTRLTGRTTADFIMRDAYRRYPSFAESQQRDQLLTDVGRGLVDNLLGADPRNLVGAVITSIADGRIQVFSDHRDEQVQLARTPIGGTAPRSGAPRLEVVVNNGAANKLDYYLDRTVRWELGPCTGRSRRSRVTVTLHSDAPTTGLPEYVLGNRDLPADGRPIPLGTNRLLVSVFSTRGSRVVGAELDGSRLAVRSGRERGLTITGFTVELASGQRRTAILDLVEPGRSGPPRLLEQPLVRPQRSVVESSPCEG